MLLKKSFGVVVAILADWILQGSGLVGSRRERCTILLGEILALRPDPFESMMRDAVQRASIF